jgi:hypothetical protein
MLFIQIIILIVMVLVMNPYCGLYYFYFIFTIWERNGKDFHKVSPSIWDHN